MDLYNIKLSVRNLKRHKLYSILSIAGFSVGFAVCIFIAQFIYNELSMDKWYPNYKNTVLAYESKDNFSNLDIQLNQDFKDKYPEVVAACPLDQIGYTEISAKTDQNFMRFTGLILTNNDFFSVFPIKVLESSGEKPFDGKESFLITRSFAKLIFPNENPLGKQMTVFGNMKGQITAIIEDFPKNSSLQAQVLVNADNPDFLLSQNCNNGRCWNPINHFLLLRPGTDRTALAKRMSKNFSKNHPEIHSIDFQRLQDIYLSPLNGSCNNSGNKSLLIILFSVGLIVLTLSTVNFLNFYIAMQYSKLKEIGIKKINGASFTNLLRFTLSEVSVSVFISVVIALVLFLIFLPLGNQLFDRNMDVGLLFNPTLLLILLLVTGIIILVNSIAPLMILSRFNASSFLTKMKISGNRQIGRKVLTLLQLSVSMVLIIVVIGLSRQISYVKNANLGFQKEHLLRLKLPSGFKSQDAMKQKLAGLPFCQSISLSRGVPGSIDMGIGDFYNGKSINLECLYVDEDFFKTLGLKITSGREFLSGDMGTTCIFNEEAMKQYGWDNVDGKRFNNGREGGYQVVGVVNDFHVNSLHEKIEPVCIMVSEPDNHGNLRNVSIRLVAGNLGQQMEQLKKVWKTFVPDEPMNFSFYDEQFDAMYHKDDQLSKAIGIISVIALILTFMGILGQVFQISLNRTKEIGVRKVNGATVFDILTYMNKEFVIWTCVAIIIATPLAWYLINRWLENFAYKTTIGWFVYIASGCIMLIAVILIVTLQSWKSAIKNPVEALKYE